MRYLYIPIQKFSLLEMEANRILKYNGSPVRYALFRNKIEVWYPPRGEVLEMDT